MPPNPTDRIVTTNVRVCLGTVRARCAHDRSGAENLGHECRAIGTSVGRLVDDVDRFESTHAANPANNVTRKQNAVPPSKPRPTRVDGQDARFFELARNRNSAASQVKTA